MKKHAVIYLLAIFIPLFFLCCGDGGGGADAVEAYTIVYNGNGAENGTVPDPHSVNYPQGLSDNVGNLAKNGYLFDGWNSLSDGSGIDYAPGTPYSGSDIILYAKWAAIFDYELIAPASPSPAGGDAEQKAPPVSSDIRIVRLTERGKQLANIDIPAKINGYEVREIGNKAFWNCSNIETVTVPETVTSIGAGAFAECAKLYSLTMKGTTPPAAGSDAFPDSHVRINVPPEAENAYQGTSYSAMIVFVNSFYVTYDKNGADGGAVPSGQVGTNGVSVNIYGNTGSLTRAGCTFNGWNTKADGSGNRFAPSATYSGPDDIVLYAQWYHDPYIVTFDSQDARTLASPASIEVNAPANTMSTLPSNPVKTGYYFAGWYTGANGTGNKFEVGSPVLSSMTVYAYWTSNTYTVHFNANGGTGGTMDAQSFAYGEEKNLSANTFSKIGYKFATWNTKSDGSGTSYSDEESVSNLSEVDGATVTLYAQWTAKTNTAYKVEHYQQDVTGSGYTLKDTDDLTGTTGGTTNAAAKTYEGFKAPTFDQKTIAADGSTVVEIKYERITYTVKFNANGHGTAPSNITVRYDATITKPADPTAVGVNFGGWYKESACSTAWDFTNDTVTGNTTLYAKWTAKEYTITYLNQGGFSFVGTHASEHPTTHTYGTDTTLKGATRSGYTFGGWFTTSDCYGTAITSLEATVYISDITLYAKWNLVQYTISYTLGGGTATNPTGYSVESEIITLNNPTKTGYTFTGWSGTDLTGDANKPVTIPHGSTGDRSYIAHWQANTYTVILDGNGGTGGSATVVYDAMGLAEITHAQHEGYTLTGYWTAASGGTMVADADGKLVSNVSGYTDGEGKWTKAENCTLHAQWLANAGISPIKSVDVTLDYTCNGTVYYSSYDSEQVTVRTGETTKLVFTSPTAAVKTLEGFYAEASCTTKVAGADGTLIFNVSGYTDEDGKWKKTDNCTLYAKWN